MIQEKELVEIQDLASLLINWSSVIKKPIMDEYDEVNIFFKNYISKQCAYEERLVNMYKRSNNLSSRDAVQELTKKGDIFGVNDLSVRLENMTYGKSVRVPETNPNDVIGSYVARVFDDARLKPKMISLGLDDVIMPYGFVIGPSFDSVSNIKGCVSRNLRDDRYVINSFSIDNSSNETNCMNFCFGHKI